MVTRIMIYTSKIAIARKEVIQMNAVVFFIIGFIIGSILAKKLFIKDPIGTLRIDNSDPDSPPYLFLEIDHGNARKIQEDKYVIFRVDTSQK